MTKRGYKLNRARLQAFGDVFKPEAEGLDILARTHKASAEISRLFASMAGKARYFVTGQKVSDGAGKGAEETNRPHILKHPVWQQLADDYFGRHPDASTSQAARHVARKTGDKFNTIRQHIKKPPKS